MLACLVGWAGCTTPVPLLQSVLTSPGLTVADGDVSEWQNALTPLDKAPLTLGVRNSAKALHIALVSTNTEVLRHVLTTGLVVWIDPEGNQSKSYGLHFPLGAARDGEVPEAVARGRIPGSGAMSERLRAAVGEFAIIENGVRTVHPRGSLEGFATEASLQAGTVVLELTVPLNSATRHALTAQPGTEISVGIETPLFDRDGLRDQLRERERQRGSADLPGGGIGSRRGGTLGGRADGRLPDPINAWVRVALAR